MQSSGVGIERAGNKKKTFLWRALRRGKVWIPRKQRFSYRFLRHCFFARCRMANKHHTVHAEDVFFLVSLGFLVLFFFFWECL